MRPFVLVFILFGVAACKDDPATSQTPNVAPTVSAGAVVSKSPRTVAYFLENPGDHDAVKRRCRNDPGALRNTSDCINADQAQKQIFVWGRDEALRRAREGS
jgi:hypothetical protein